MFCAGLDATALPMVVMDGWPVTTVAEVVLVVEAVDLEGAYSMTEALVTQHETMESVTIECL